MTSGVIDGHNSVRNVTEWASASESMRYLEYGVLTYRQWCEKEMARINRKGDGVRIIGRPGGEICLTR